MTLTCTVPGCQRKHAAKGLCFHHYNHRRSRLLRTNGPWDDIGLPDLHERDGGICHICGEPVPPHYDKNSGDGWSMDHVVPISRGGTHTWDNVKLAHRRCNSKKNDRLLGEHGRTHTRSRTARPDGR